MTGNEYQYLARQTAIYPHADKFMGLVYCILGLGSEAGELQGKLKKVFRDNNGILTDSHKQKMIKELGDVMWYVSQVASELGVSLNEVMRSNIDNLQGRKHRGTLCGDGDDR